MVRSGKNDGDWLIDSFAQTFGHCRESHRLYGAREVCQRAAAASCNRQSTDAEPARKNTWSGSGNPENSTARRRDTNSCARNRQNFTQPDAFSSCLIAQPESK